MIRSTRRRRRWTPSRIDFATWAVCSLWDAFGQVMTTLHAMRARPRSRRTAPVWFGSKPA